MVELTVLVATSVTMIVDVLRMVDVELAGIGRMVVIVVMVLVLVSVTSGRLTVWVLVTFRVSVLVTVVFTVVEHLGTSL